MRRPRFVVVGLGSLLGERGRSGGRSGKPLLVYFSAGRDLLFL